MRLTLKLLTTIELMKTKKLAPIHPGEILREEFMKPHRLSQNALARALAVPPRRVNEIVVEKRAITADTALRLARFFGTTPELWTGLQADYDLRLARCRESALNRARGRALGSLAARPGLKPACNGVKPYICDSGLTFWLGLAKPLASCRAKCECNIPAPCIT